MASISPQHLKVKYVHNELLLSVITILSVFFCQGKIGILSKESRFFVTVGGHFVLN